MSKDAERLSGGGTAAFQVERGRVFARPERIVVSLPMGRVVTLTAPENLSASEQAFVVEHLRRFFALAADYRKRTCPLCPEYEPTARSEFCEDHEADPTAFFAVRVDTDLAANPLPEKRPSETTAVQP